MKIIATQTNVERKGTGLSETKISLKTPEYKRNSSSPSTRKVTQRDRRESGGQSQWSNAGQHVHTAVDAQSITCVPKSDASHRPWQYRIFLVVEVTGLF